MPTDSPLDALAAAAATCPEPEPRPIHRDAYDVLVEWPIPIIEALQEPGPDRVSVRMEVRPGVYDRAGGGACGMFRISWTDNPPREFWTPWHGDTDCVPAPEPAFGMMLVMGVLVLAGFRRPKRKKGPTGQ